MEISVTQASNGFIQSVQTVTCRTLYVVILHIH